MKTTDATRANRKALSQTGTAHKRSPIHHAETLSFMRVRKSKGSGIDYWVVDSTGNYSEDCDLGEKLGLEFVQFVNANPTFGNMMLIRDIVADMGKRCWAGAPEKPSYNKLTGIEIGFLSIIGHCIGFGAGIVAAREGGEA